MRLIDRIKNQIERIKPVCKYHALEIGISVLGVVLMNLIFLSNAFRETDTIEPAAAGQLGDFVGGYVGTAFALFSVALLFATLRIQRDTSAKQLFETKYFELIKMHRENVGEMKLNETEGRRVFILLIQEFRAIHQIIRTVDSDLRIGLCPEKFFQVAYNCLLHGTGPNSSRMLKKSLASFDSTFVDNLERALAAEKEEEEGRAPNAKIFEYLPFDGHQSRLDHYYRHLFQTVCYVDKQKLDIDKYEYVKTIRAQLTTHEQALLFINSLSPVGKPWWDDKLIVKYELVKNLPQDFFDKDTELDLGKDLSPPFPQKYFEWEKDRG